MKRFLDGVIFGAGFAVAFVLVLAAALYFVFPAMIRNEMVFTSGPEMVHSPPDIARPNRFLGSSGYYSEQFLHDGNRVLASGDGRIVGSAAVEGKPLAGLRLRLALNGTVMSQWGTTGADGQYEIRVPYGQYRIDGFDLDTQTANSVLAGKIGDPQNPVSSGKFEVAEGAPGHGLNLKFVEPVALEIPKSRFSADEDIVIRWKPYPGAQEYEVQIFERAEPGGYGKREPVFPWSESPVVKEPVINLGDYDVELKTGYYYTVEVEARAGPWQPISRTALRFSEFDFEVVE